MRVFCYRKLSEFGAKLMVSDFQMAKKDKTSKRKFRNSELRFGLEKELKSLILAQIERWRHA